MLQAYVGMVLAFFFREYACKLMEMLKLKKHKREKIQLQSQFILTGKAEAIGSQASNLVYLMIKGNFHVDASVFPSVVWSK